MPITETLALALPFVLAGVVVLALQKLARETPLSAIAGPLVALGIAATLALLVGAPSIPPANAAEWTWVALVLGGLLALVPGVPGALLVGVTALGSTLALARPLFASDDRTLAIVGAVLLGVGAAANAHAPGRDDTGARARTGGIAVLFLALGLTLALSGSIRYAFLAFGAGLALGGLTLASLFVDGALGRAPLAMGASLYAVIASMGVLYVETPLLSKGALLVAPLALAGVTPFVERALANTASSNTASSNTALSNKRRARVLAGAIAVLVPFVVAVVAAALAFEPDPYASYR
jgi:hypothetical protein